MPSPLTQEQVNLLREPLPQAAVSQRPDKKFLSSIKAIYVSERLNKVFGIGGWKIYCNRIIENDPAKPMVVIEATLEVPSLDMSYSSFGGHDNADRGDAYKGAITDALTKIAAVYFEVGIDVFKGLQDGNGKTPTATVKPLAEKKPETADLSTAPLINKAQELLEKVSGKTGESATEILKLASGYEDKAQKFWCLTPDTLKTTTSEKWLKMAIANLEKELGG